MVSGERLPLTTVGISLRPWYGPEPPPLRSTPQGGSALATGSFRVLTLRSLRSSPELVAPSGVDSKPRPRSPALTIAGVENRAQLIMRAAKLTSGDPAAQAQIDSRGGTIIFPGDDIVSIMVKRFPMQNVPHRPAGLSTDSDIGGRMAGGFRSERKLQEVMPPSWPV